MRTPWKQNLNLSPPQRVSCTRSRLMAACMQFGSQSISRCSINVEDLVPMPNQAVLVTKCLQGWDSGNAGRQRTDLHWSARIHPEAPDADASRPSATEPPAGPGQGGSRSGRSDILDVYDACGMHGPDALRWAAHHSAEAGGSLASDRALPDDAASSGWLMFEVRPGTGEPWLGPALHRGQL